MERREAVALARIADATQQHQTPGTSKKEVLEAAQREHISWSEYLRAHALLVVAGGDKLIEEVLINEN
jgi:hypothetical protein